MADIESKKLEPKVEGSKRATKADDEGGLKIEYGKICCQYFVAPMGCGKTSVLKSLIRSAAAKGVYSGFLVMSPTRLSGEWDELPEEAVVSFSPESLVSIYRQIRHYKEKCHADGQKPKLRRICIILDDAMGSVNKLWQYNGGKGADPEDSFLNCFISTRHYKIDLWVTAQHYTGAPPYFRNCMNRVWIWPTSNPAVTKPLYQFVGGLCDSHKHFCEVLREATREPYSVLVVNPKAKTFEEMYTSFTPELPKPFQLNYKLPFNVF